MDRIGRDSNPSASNAAGSADSAAPGHAPSHAFGDALPPRPAGRVRGPRPMPEPRGSSRSAIQAQMADQSGSPLGQVARFPMQRSRDPDPLSTALTQEDQPRTGQAAPARQGRVMFAPDAQPQTAVIVAQPFVPNTPPDTPPSPGQGLRRSNAMRNLPDASGSALPRSRGNRNLVGLAQAPAWGADSLPTPPSSPGRRPLPPGAGYAGEATQPPTYEESESATPSPAGSPAGSPRLASDSDTSLPDHTWLNRSATVRSNMTALPGYDAMERLPGYQISQYLSHPNFSKDDARIVYQHPRSVQHVRAAFQRSVQVREAAVARSFGIRNVLRTGPTSPARAAGLTGAEYREVKSAMWAAASNNVEGHTLRVANELVKELAARGRGAFDPFSVIPNAEDRAYLRAGG